MKVLYLPQTANKNDRVAEALEGRFIVQKAADFDDVESILSLQVRNRTYAFRALVIGKDTADLRVHVGRMRRVCPNVPFVCLTRTRPIAALKAELLAAGADDCLPVRHVSADELIAVIEQRDRVYGLLPKDLIVTIGNMEVNLYNRQISCEAKFAVLSQAEWPLFQAIICARNGVATHEMLETVMSGGGYSTVPNTISVLLWRIRAKLQEIDARVVIVSRHGQGYGIEAK